jgi:hypothetical protein
MLKMATVGEMKQAEVKVKVEQSLDFLFSAST